MKPFNLENFLEGEPAITRDGRKVIDWHYFKDVADKYKLACVINGGVIFYTDKGITEYSYKGDRDSPLNLFMEEKEVDLWINVYESENSCYDGWFHGTESEAKSNVLESSNFKGTHKITIKE